MLPALFNLPDAYRGDSYGPITLSFYDLSNNPVDMTGISMVDCEVGTTGENREIVLSWKPTTNGVHLSGNQITLLTVPGSSMRMPAGIYWYDFEITTNVYTQTYLRGNLTVYDEVTNY